MLSSAPSNTSISSVGSDASVLSINSNSNGNANSKKQQAQTNGSTSNGTSNNGNSANGGLSQKSLMKRRRVQQRMDAVKKKHRSSLKLSDWQRYNFVASYRERCAPIVSRVEALQRAFDERLAAAMAKTGGQWDGARLPFPCNYDARLPKEQHRLAGGLATITHAVSGVPRIHEDNVSLQEFIERFEKPGVPVVIDGCTRGWPAVEKWKIDVLKDGPYRDCFIKCGEDDDGYSVKVKLKTFMRYLRYNRDDSPLYVFDEHFDENPVSRSMLTDYTLPRYFRDDLLRLVGEKRRPPYRWFLIGPERSGSSLHIDPLNTSAWNTLLSGRKLWVLFKPEAARKIVKANNLKMPGEDGEAIMYFLNILPRLRELEEKKDQPDLGMIEFIQYPGETVFVPGGWWHAVLNLDDTIAVTQNFASCTNFHKVWVKARKSRKHMSRRWLHALAKDYPQLVKEAHALNKRDNFDFTFAAAPKPSKSNDGKDGKAGDSSSSSSSSSSSDSSSSSESDY